MSSFAKRQPSTIDDILATFPEAGLTVRDRLNFSFLLASQVMTFQRAILNLEYSAEEIREAVEGLVHMIPNSWKDNDFKQHINRSKIQVREDVRPVFCGARASVETCTKLGLPIVRNTITFDYYEVFQACIDLFDRRGLLSRRIYKEVMTGRKARPGLEEIGDSEAEEY